MKGHFQVYERQCILEKEKKMILRNLQLSFKWFSGIKGATLFDWLVQTPASERKEAGRNTCIQDCAPMLHWFMFFLRLLMFDIHRCKNDMTYSLWQLSAQYFQRAPLCTNISCSYLFKLFPMRQIMVEIF